MFLPAFLGFNNTVSIADGNSFGSDVDMDKDDEDNCYDKKIKKDPPTGSPALVTDTAIVHVPDAATSALVAPYLPTNVPLPDSPAKSSSAVVTIPQNTVSSLQVAAANILTQEDDDIVMGGENSHLKRGCEEISVSNKKHAAQDRQPKEGESNNGSSFWNKAFAHDNQPQVEVRFQEKIDPIPSNDDANSKNAHFDDIASFDNLLC